ncbi:hypothetical protein EVAR_64948_1 [Eumeta japonica]|uniref:Uncharacterized protein n=1 Tax=Eumeta variegata TaxID=151549 RepID=A0A4C1ZE96_EUMVA|nr:hypothetical protein EVAR_64948_1 [Eumeta japonica]
MACLRRPRKEIRNRQITDLREHKRRGSSRSAAAPVGGRHTRARRTRGDTHTHAGAPACVGVGGATHAPARSDWPAAWRRHAPLSTCAMRAPRETYVWHIFFQFRRQYRAAEVFHFARPV